MGTVGDEREHCGVCVWGGGGPRERMQGNIAGS